MLKCIYNWFYVRFHRKKLKNLTGNLYDLMSRGYTSKEAIAKLQEEDNK